MSSEINFIKLPLLTRIKVKNYPLFARDWEYCVKTGLNLFIGANGLGKTTVTNLIIYAIVGYIEELDTFYFRARNRKKTANIEYAEAPTVYVEFEIGDSKIKIERLIEDNKIKVLEFDDNIYSAQEIDDLESVYEEILTKKTGIEYITDIGFLLKYFLIREEEGNYLIWDNKGAEQSKLIRLLINESGFEKDYTELSEKLTELDTKFRRTQDTIIKPFRQRIQLLKQSREEQLKKKTDYNTLLEARLKLENVQQKIDETKRQRDGNSANMRYITGTLKQNENNISAVKAEYEAASDKARELETKLYKNIFLNSKASTALHKLDYYNICIFCNTTTSDRVSKQIIESVRIKHKCPVCDSGISHEENIQKTDNNDVLREELNKAEPRMKELKGRLDLLESNSVRIKAQLDELWSKQNLFDKDLSNLSVEQYELRERISNLNKNPEEQVTGFDSQIIELEKTVQDEEEKLQIVKEELEGVKNILIKKNAKLNETISYFNKKLNDIFSKYASLYFDQGACLEEVSRRPTESKIDLVSYVPTFGGKKRIHMRECSTSQRLMLEYLFRISIIELYTTESQNSAFIILETSEGAFDISNTTQMARAFTKFGKENPIPCIVIANFSKADFLEELGRGIENSKERLLNFLDFGNLSENQKDDIEKFQKIIHNLSLN